MLVAWLPAAPGLDERIDVLKRHYELNMEYKGQRVGVTEMRKHLSGYLKGLPYIAKFRLELMQFEKPEPIFEKLEALKNATHYRDLIAQTAPHAAGAYENGCGL